MLILLIKLCDRGQCHCFRRDNMSDLAWAVKNGDMEQVKEMVESKVREATCTSCQTQYQQEIFHFTPIRLGWIPYRPQSIHPIKRFLVPAVHYLSTVHLQSTTCPVFLHSTSCPQYFCSQLPVYSTYSTVRHLQGVDVNTAIDGRLPLHYASDYGQLEVIQYLISKVLY